MSNTDDVDVEPTTLGDVAEKLPGMKSGATGRNLVVGVLYLFLLPFVISIVVVLLPIVTGAVVGTNYRGAADRLTALPGVSKGGGVKTGLVAGFYGLVIWALFGVAGGDDPNGDVPTIENNDADDLEETNAEAEDTETDATDETEDDETEGEEDEVDADEEDEVDADVEREDLENGSEEGNGPSEEGEEVTLRLSVMDETEDNPPDERAEVWIRGTGSWYPSVEFGGETLEDAGPFERYSEGEIYIYPDERDGGVEILATVYFDEDFISNSPRDSVRIEIHDDRVVVVGTPVEAQHGEYEREFDR